MGAVMGDETKVHQLPGFNAVAGELNRLLDTARAAVNAGEDAKLMADTIRAVATIVEAMVPA